MTSYESPTSRLVQQELGACALIQDLLPLYIEGEVTPASRDLIAEHIAHCDRCAGFLAGARSVREQLRRETTLRETSVGHDQAARQAIITGQRRVMALALGIFALLFLSMAAAAVAIGFFRSAGAPAPAPIVEPAGMPSIVPFADPQLFDAELRRRADQDAARQQRMHELDQLAPQDPLDFPTPVPEAPPDLQP
jgi:hypothetical protein